MKKLMLTLVLITASVVALMAQVKKTEKISEDEVPVVVRQAFEKDFGQIPADGVWTVAFNMVTEGNRTVARPLYYQYVKGPKSERIDVRYTPDGKLEQAKGLTKTEGPAQ